MVRRIFGLPYPQTTAQIIATRSTRILTSGNWTCPTKYVPNSLKARLVGGGSSGGSYPSSNYGSVGGSGGEVLDAYPDVVAGTAYPAVVGAGGASPAQGANAAPVGGSSTTFAGLTARGAPTGPSGGLIPGAPGGPGGGSGGTASYGANGIVISGSPGAPGLGGFAGGGGGAGTGVGTGGTGHSGGGAGGSLSNAGNAAPNSGAGGGGGMGGASAGAGGSGIVILEWEEYV